MIGGGNMTNRDLHNPVPEYGSHLSRYVLVEHLQTSGVTFDAHMTALDHYTIRYRLRNAVFRAINTHGLSFSVDHDLMKAADRGEGAVFYTIHQPGPSVHYDYVPDLSICDRERLLDGIEKLSEADIRTLTQTKEDGTEDSSDETRLAAVAIAERLAAILDQTVTLKILAAIEITQGVAEGQTPDKRAFDPMVSNANKLELTECAITEAGVRIEAYTGTDTLRFGVVSVKNDLTDRKITLSDGETVKHTVKPGYTWVLHPTDLTKPLTLGVVKVPDKEPESDTQA